MIPPARPVLYKLSPPWAGPMLETKHKIKKPPNIPDKAPNFPLMGDKVVEKNTVIAKEGGEAFE